MAFFGVAVKNEAQKGVAPYQNYSRKPYRNYYHCNKPNEEWNDLCRKGYGILKVYSDNEYVYFGTLKALWLVFRKNVSRKYYESIDA